MSCSNTKKCNKELSNIIPEDTSRHTSWQRGDFKFPTAAMNLHQKINGSLQSANEFPRTKDKRVSSAYLLLPADICFPYPSVPFLSLNGTLGPSEVPPPLLALLHPVESLVARASPTERNISIIIF